ncbi:GAF domain-containing protein [Flexibacter flexilis DSM 6793]|uniref:GAF domain-containing protein n=1 Tax=Flexibacter flexilis DSM 6793 TaxID=927664 RepID=A0A1I1MZ01_9BACT|nr:GAF domain-containing protein [Flexibacter flexilis]SFC87813.1 GAF domain-containing protein [Flexibacter flexilis DSM 6793]
MKSGIRYKIFIGFFTLIAIFVFNAALSVYTLRESENIIKRNSEIIDPSLEGIKEFEKLVIRSKMYTTNWVYLRENEEDKQSLKQLHNVEYPTLKEKIKALMPYWEDRRQTVRMDSIFQKFEKLLILEKEIMQTLVSFDDYEDPIKKFTATGTIETQLIPASSVVLKELSVLSDAKRKEVAASKEKLLDSFDVLRWIIIGLGIALSVIGVVRATLTANSITRPLKYIQGIILRLGVGELPEESNRTFNNDEIGEMAKAVEQLVAGLRATSNFAENIGNGNLKASFTPLSDADVLGNSLLEMRSNLQKVAEDDKKRNWATEGVAKFSEILRQNNDNINKLSDEIVANLVKYLGANQGGLYIVNEDDTNDEPYLYLAGCYAWDKKKYIDQKIAYGEGLTGQSWQEKDTLFITDVPQDYISITSGLGDANPTSIIIVPLKINEQVYGVVEMASFNVFQDFEIEFVEKIGESIASTLSTAKVNERTTRLLEESQMMTEQMKAQEEEMRQNMEELQATQEEMERAQLSISRKEKLFDSTMVVLELDNSFSITSANEMADIMLGYRSRDLTGSALKELISDETSLSQLKSSLMLGQVWQGTTAIRSSKGGIVKVKLVAGSTTDEFESEHSYLVIMLRLDS